MTEFKERWCSVAEAAKLLNRSYAGVMLLVERNVLPALKIGGRKYVSREHVDRLIRGEINAEYRKQEE